MPTPNHKRVYKKGLKGSEYDRDHSSAKDKKDRAARNKAHATKTEQVGEAAMKGKDVHHKDGDPTNNAPSNLQITDPHDNRGKLREALGEGSSYG